MLRLSLIAVTVSLAWISASNGEYVWTGSEWKWKDPADSDLSLPSGGSDTSSSFGGTSSIDEGSGDGDNWDDDYEEDYEDYTYDDYDKPSKPKKDKKKNKWDDGGSKKNKKKNKNRDRNTGILPASDDEDFYEGSGSDDFDLPRANNNPYNNNNNYNFNNNPVSQFTTPQTPSYNNNNYNQNVYVDGEDDEYEYDDEYDDEYDYDEDDDISFGGNNNENPWDTGNNPVIVDTTAKPKDNIYNMNNVNNVWENPATTVRSYTPRTTTTTTTQKPVSNRGNQNNNNQDHSFIPVNRPASFFAQPGILAAVIGGAVVGLLCAILLVMFIVYRMRKKDEGSYALDEPKRAHNVNSYSKPPSREFYA